MSFSWISVLLFSISHCSSDTQREADSSWIFSSKIFVALRIGIPDRLFGGGLCEPSVIFDVISSRVAQTQLSGISNGGSIFE